LPQVKRFLKEPGGVDQYSMVKIEWIRHHNPDLVVEDDDGRKRTLDLSMYSYKQLHALFQAEFKPPTSVVPVNNATRWHRESAIAATPLLKYDAGLPNPHAVHGGQPADNAQEQDAGDVLLGQWMLPMMKVVIILVSLVMLVRCGLDALGQRKQRNARLKAAAAADGSGTPLSHVL